MCSVNCECHKTAKSISLSPNPYERNDSVSKTYMGNGNHKLAACNCIFRRYPPDWSWKIYRKCNLMNCQQTGVFSIDGVPLIYLGDGDYESMCCECTYYRFSHDGGVRRTEKCSLDCECHTPVKQHITKEQLDAELDEYISHKEGCQCHKHFVPADPLTDQNSGDENM